MDTRKTKEKIEFGNRLREARLASGFAVRSVLAEHAGISRSAIACYENGETNPPGDVLAKLCQVLNVEATWLYGLDHGEMPKQGKHEKASVEAEIARRAKEYFEDDDGADSPEEDAESILETVDQLIDALDSLMEFVPGYLVEGNALREALQGDPNGDKAPAYVSLLSSQPSVVNYYRDRTHMRQLAMEGKISEEEYAAWFCGCREKITHMVAKKQGKEAKDAAQKPRMKCTAEKL